PGRGEPALHRRVRGGGDRQCPRPHRLGLDGAEACPDTLGAIRCIAPALMTPAFMAIRRPVSYVARHGGRLSGHSQPLGTLDVALSHAARLLPTKPALAAEQAAEILKVVPEHPGAMLLLASAQRACGGPSAALDTLQRLC